MYYFKNKLDLSLIIRVKSTNLVIFIIFLKFFFALSLYDNIFTSKNGDINFIPIKTYFFDQQILIKFCIVCFYNDGLFKGFRVDFVLRLFLIIIFIRLFLNIVLKIILTDISTKKLFFSV